MSERPVFFDPAQRRWRGVLRIGAVLGALTVGLGAAFLVTLLLIPALPPLPGLTAPLQRALHPGLPRLPRRSLRLRRFLLNRSRRELEREIRAQRVKPPARRAGGGPMVGAFYATWLEEGLHSLRANASQLTHLFPEWVHLSSNGADLDLYDWDPLGAPHNADVLKIARANGLSLMPVFSNAQKGRFDPERAHRLLTEPARQARVARLLLGWVETNGFQGINVDFENLAPEDDLRLPEFLLTLRRVFKPRGLAVSVDIQATGSNVDWTAAARAVDFVVLMVYDESYQTGDPGPVASIQWTRSVLDQASRTVPRSKLVIGIGNYSYDWKIGHPPAESLSYQAALLAARDHNPGLPPSKIVDYDPRALNPTFNYLDDDGKPHEVWMLDAVTAANQWMLAQRMGPRGAALWVIGSEDPSIWKFLGRDHIERPVELVPLESIEYPYDVEYQGGGEILSVKALPQPGERRLERDPKNGLALDETYDSFPTAFVLNRSGLTPKAVALTFDDGPSDPFTAEILGLLKEEEVRGTFFVIGENAERFPDLLERAWREGHEIGNHTYTHPNTGAVSDKRIRLEMTATQRALQSILGRSSLLFRPPYNADAEPTSSEEVHPIELASELGYVTVGEFIDPRDWDLLETMADGQYRRRGASDIADRVIQQVHSGHGNVVLLHDGGGDRSQTVEALKLIIPELRREGYRFVTVSELLGVGRDAVMPPLSEQDTALWGIDRTVFEAGYWLSLLLRAAFLSAIALAVVRTAFITVLASIAYRRELRRPAADHRPPVSVLIAAYNERPVIQRTLRAALASDYPPIEVVVVDDGSTDGTAEEVERAFPAEPRLRLLRQENRGKAAALNAAAAASTGPILVCLDADTQLRPDAIAKLALRLYDPAVGAVAGNVKVGNRNNPLTKLQAIEYITTQNLERRAYAMLNAVTVVPGAAGAWRRSAVEAAGGFQSDTLAEDMDLTWRLRRAGWRIETESEAWGLTEAPETLRGLFRQRFRWVYGTLQSLWKHRDALGRYGWFGRLLLPYLWLFQIGYQALSPLIDLQIAWALLSFAQSWLVRGLLVQDWQPLPDATDQLYHLGLLYALFCAVEAAGSALALWMDDEPLGQSVWVFGQRFVYRQLMYAVVLKSIATALKGGRTGWGKLERRGTVGQFEGADRDP